MPCTTRLVLVPMSVHTPPNMVAYDRGMSSFVAATPYFSAQRFIMGANITTTGVLLRKADIKAITGSMRACTCRSPAPCWCGSKRRRSASSKPDRRTPSLTRKSMATVIMPLLAKPSSSSLGDNMPAHMNTTAPEKSINPGRILSFINAVMTKNNTIITNSACNVKMLIC